MEIDAIIFDLDDTLVAFDLVTESTWLEVCEEFARENPPFSAKEIYDAVITESHWYWSDEERHRIGRNDIVMARRGIVRSAFDKHGIPLRDAERVANRYSELKLENIYVLPGAIETLSEIAGREIRLGLISNGDSPIQRQKLKRFDLEKYFDVILIEGEVGYGKPDRRIYEVALSKMNTAGERTMMVGDNLKWDVAGPQSVGMYGIWFDVKRRGLPEDSGIRPDGVITDISQILDYLDEKPPASP